MLRDDIIAAQERFSGNDFPTFCQDCATNGVCRWVVDLVAKSCRYFDLEDKVVYTETIPL